MKPSEIVKFFGTQAAAADFIDVSQPCISNWLKRGKVPPLQQVKIEHLTEGRLTVDKSVANQLRPVKTNLRRAQVSRK